METRFIMEESFFTALPLAQTGNEKQKQVEYLLVIYPGEELNDLLLNEQEQFVNDYGMQVSIRNKPHITLASFQSVEHMENTMIRWIQRICSLQKSFQVTLNNYSGIPSHTIYLRIQDPSPFFPLVQQLKAVDDFIRSPEGPPFNLVSRPYLSIAGGLTEQIYGRAMPDYSRKTFHESFQVRELILLKRDHSFDSCRTVNIFRLLPEDPAPGAGNG